MCFHRALSHGAILRCSLSACSLAILQDAKPSAGTSAVVTQTDALYASYSDALGFQNHAGIITQSDVDG